ncbi:MULTISPECIES: class I SAM-dependent methyltransferase [Microbacterium]|jgi:SAM-dependent methyltransferase|uniref:class I SAM-dependent methyltransferase n=1 Tax=Microbacterium TaxID=33882 RepID=UPI001D17C621|nr:class I SAM-dependent methyltransferase [Microbacterium testaceum]MCC4249535.1 class I SAM-dependent methyltransferase [Microbacterium testaceum]
MTERQKSTSFGQAAAAYESGRPEYPSDAVAWMLAPVREPGRALRVADVGAGTGKLTRAVVELGADVVAIDPDAEMLATLRESVRGVPTFAGTAESLLLPDSALDAVVMGQAWHWVDPDAGSREIARVLRSGGVLGLVWNIRDASVDWVRRLTAAMGGSHAEVLLATTGPRVAAPLADLEHRSWRWSRRITLAQLRDLVFSRSDVITASPEDRVRIDAEVDGVVASVPGLADGGSVDLPYVTHAFRARRP